MTRHPHVMDMFVTRVSRDTLTSWQRRDGAVPECSQCLKQFEIGEWYVARPRRSLIVHHTCMAACSIRGGFTGFEMDAVSARIAQSDPDAVGCSVPQGVLK